MTFVAIVAMDTIVCLAIALVTRIWRCGTCGGHALGDLCYLFQCFGAAGQAFLQVRVFALGEISASLQLQFLITWRGRIEKEKRREGGREDREEGMREGGERRRKRIHAQFQKSKISI